MSSIDNRVVEMRFDNQQFENGVRTSVKSLDNLKKGLDLDGAAKSLSNLERVGNKFSLAGIAAGVDVISSKMQNLGIVGITILQNLTNSAVNAGKRIVSALTIDPIFAGFDEYETKMGAIQTILTNTASKGTTLKDVNKALNELNEYSDKTIYNFAEMAKNIGTFTAAGVDLNTSVSSIKGIANLAAGSGSTSIQAATAMYQLSQAIASGSVKLMDWNSVVNAGMGGELFQNALKKTAKEMGKVIDEGKPFRETLEQGWVTTEVLTKTLAKFAEDKSLVEAATQVKTFTQLFSTMKESVQSGWAQSWEAIIGDKNESTATLTAISEAFGSVVGESAKARNEMLSFWKANGGREAVLQGLSNALIFLANVLEPLEKAFNDIFPAMTGKRLVELSKSFKDLTANFKIGADTVDKIKRTFKGLFALIDIGRMAFVGIVKIISGLIPIFKPLGDGVLGFTSNVGDSMVALRDFIKNSEGLTVFFKELKALFQPILNGVSRIISLIVNGFDVIGDAGSNSMDSFSQRMQKIFAPVIAIGRALLTIFQKIFPIIAEVFEGIGNVVERFVNKVATEIKDMKFETLIGIINGVFMTGLLTTVNRFVKTMTDITKGGTSIFSNISNILDGVGKSLEAYQRNLNAKSLLLIATSIAILAASLISLSLLDPSKLESSLEAISVLFAQMFIATGLFGKVLSGAKLLTSLQAVATFGGLAIAILILSKAMSNIASVDWAGLTKGTIAIGLLMGMVIATTNLVKTGPNLIRTGIGLIAFAMAINVLASAVKKLGAIDMASLTKGLIGVGVLLGEISLFLKVANLKNIGPLNTIGLIGLAISLNILASAVSKFGSLDVASIIKGLTTMGIVLAELSLFLKFTAKPEGLVTTSIGLMLLGTAMLIFGKAISNIGSLPLDTLIKGLAGLALSLVAISMSMKLMPGNMLLTGAALLGVSVALNILAVALRTMGGMSLADIGKGLLALGGSLAILAGGMALMAGGLPGALAMMAMAVALGLFVPTLAILSSIPLGGIVVGLIALAGVFTVIGVAGMLLAPLTPVLMALGASILMLGAGILAVGGGVMLFAAGLGLLVSNLVLLGTSVGTASVAIAKALPVIGAIFASIFTGIIKIIAESGPALVKALVVLIDSLIQALEISIPKILSLFLKLILDILDQVNKALPAILKMGGEIVINLLKGIDSMIFDIVDVAISIVINFIKGVTSRIGDIIQAGINLMIAFINGLADGIRNNTDKMIDAMSNLVLAIVDAAVKGLSGAINLFGDVGKQVVTGFINGIKGMVSKAKETAVALGKSVLDATKSALGIRSPSKLFKEIGDNIGAGLTKGITDSGKQAVNASTDMSKKVTNASKDVVKTSAKAAETSNEAAKKAFDKSVEWIDERKYYNQLSLDEELAAWERVQQRYMEGSDERKKADREVYRVKKELLKAEEEATQKAFKAQYDNSINWIDDRKYYSELALTEELAAWKRVQKRYEAGTDERKKADREVYRVQNEINKTNEEYTKNALALQKETLTSRKDLEDEYYDKTKEINDKLKQDIKSVTDEYEKAVDARAKSIYDSYGLFDKVGKQDPVKGYELIENLQGQVSELETWRDDLNSLSTKIADKGLMKELEDMGPKAVPQIKALNNLSASELDKYVYLWRKKHKEAKGQAIVELEGIRVESSKKISELEAQAETDLDSYRKVWASKMKTLKEESVGELNDLKSQWGTKIGELRGDTEKEFTTLTFNIKKELKKPNWTSFGENIIRGIQLGIRSKAMNVASEAASAAQATLQSAKDELGIRSPSKEFAKVGMYAIQGLVDGLKKYSGMVVSAGSNVGDIARTSLKDTFSNLSSLLSADMDMSPTIRPVLDMTAVETGLASTFGKTRGVNVASVTAKAANISGVGTNGYGSNSVTNETDNTKNTDIKIVNNYTVRSNDDIRKISNDLKNTLDRYNFAKGVAVV